ncbi:glutathione reductase [Hanseniaspora valbyensis NRRL Y-1626]|uniref:Glutathione reductase n=1 Tax=Hanseniaspora valbyensis NRRL Y-1626 TaxID=766949 RepID=A0A1B7TEP7_9ASCO|nr:glutathione reductase [Hanseniaspora valbyensis NRRL Y-1626]
MSNHYDILVIGGGSGGTAFSRRAASYGAKTLVVEAKNFGGTCVQAGCVPKKVTWNAADLAKKVQHANNYGLYKQFPLNKENLTFDWPFFKEKRDAYIQRLFGIYERNLTKEGVDYVYGYAKIIKDNTVEVSLRDEPGKTKVYTADKILVATGGKPVHPENIEGYEYGTDSDGFFKLEEQPKNVVIVGAGYIAVELAGVFNSLGSNVSLAIRGETVLRNFDSIIQDTITEEYINQGINVLKKHNVAKVELEQDGESKKISFENGEILENIDCLIWAIGRRSHLGLGLETIGVELNDRELIVVDEYQNTNVKDVYSLGDVVGKIELTPVAIATGRKLANRLFGPEKFKNEKQDFTNVPSAIFSHPEAGSIGLSEKEAIEKYGKDDLKVYTSSFRGMYYAMLDEEQKEPTKYKLICQGPNEKVVGLHLVGDFSAEILQGFGVAVKMGATKADFDSCVAIHPTSAEEIVTLR